MTIPLMLLHKSRRLGNKIAFPKLASIKTHVMFQHLMSLHTSGLLSLILTTLDIAIMPDDIYVVYICAMEAHVCCLLTSIFTLLKTTSIISCMKIMYHCLMFRDTSTRLCPISAVPIPFPTIRPNDVDVVDIGFVFFYVTSLFCFVFARPFQTGEPRNIYVVDIGFMSCYLEEM